MERVFLFETVENETISKEREYAWINHRIRKFSQISIYLFDL